MAVLIGVSCLSHQGLEAASSATPLPTAGSFVAGSGSIHSSSNTVTINQSTLRGIIDWSSFSIGSGGQVTFNNGAGATLNRVNGGQMSSILGSLFSSGSVYLINPQGILIGRGAHVNTGGDFAASTLNLVNATFMSGLGLDFKGNSRNVVVNLGSIFSQNGSVFLLGHDVRNDGKISAANGVIGLGAGSEILLKDSTSDQRVFVKAAGGNVTNTGTIAAAQAELKAKGGNVYALAGNSGGLISATGTATINGAVWLISDGGQTQVAGSVIASNANGSGGAIETSGYGLGISGATIKTGQGGHWLLDPVDLTVDSGAATTIQNSLATTSVTLQTTANGASGPGLQNTAGLGDINMNAPLTWNGNTTLTLDAYHGVTVNSPITSSGTAAGLTIITNDGGTGGFFTAKSPVTLASSGSLHINGSAYTLINTVSDLQNLASSGNFAVNGNLDLSGIPNFTPLNSFSGTLEGLGHTIRNLTQTGTAQYMGLFSTLAANSQVANLNLTNVIGTSAGGTSVSMGSLAASGSGTVYNVSASGQLQADANAVYVGGLIGQQTAGGAIENSSANVTVSTIGATGVYAGGLVGQSSSPISASHASGNVTATANYTILGGLVGGSLSTIDGSYATGAITGAGSTQGGGLIGNSAGAVTNSYATGSVTAGNGDDNGGHPSYIGGLIGNTTSSGTVASSYASGTISGQEDNVAGGLVGRSQGTITSSSASSNVTITDNGSAGGLVGQNFSSITTSHASGAIAGNTNVLLGGLVARDFANAPISNSYATGQVTGSDGSVGGGLTAWNASPITQSYATGAVSIGADGTAGGLSGNSFGSGTISNSYATGSVTGGDNAEVGGLTGENDLSVTQSFATGNVSGGHGSWVGGLSGYSTAPISLAFATGSVTAAGQSSQAGGLAGYASAPITNAYATGAVNGGDTTSSTGGLVGYLDTGGTIATSYSTGTVSPSGSNTGGLVGTNIGTSDVTASYWDTATSGQATSAGGTGLNTKQWLTQGPAAAGDPAWDFANTWVVGYPYPVLKAFPYVVASLTASGNRIYGGADPAISITSALDQNGQNAIGSIQGSLIPVTVASNTGIGTYNMGGSNQTVAGHQLTYLGLLTIDPATLTLTGLGASNKTYDGTTAVTLLLNGLGVSGLVGADTVNINDANVTGAFVGKDAGTNKPVNVSGISISGPDAANYVLSIPQTAATITPAPLTIDYTAANKVYDGTVAATAATIGSLSGILSGDSVSLGAGGVFDFSNKNAGVGKTVTASGFSLTGPQSGDYTLTLVQTGTAAITPAQLLYVAAPSSGRPFGANNPIISGSVAGLVGGDTLASTTTGTPVFTTVAAVSSATGSYGVTGSGLTLTTDNYVLAQSPANASAFTINPITISIGNLSRLPGTPNPTFTVSYSGPTSAYLQSVLSNLVLSTNAPSSDTPGTYQITALIPASLASSILVQPGTLTIGSALNNSLAPGAPQSVATFPAALETQTLPFSSPLPPLSGGSSSGNQLLPTNAIGQFLVTITPSPAVNGTGFQAQPNGGALSQASFTENSPDGRSKDNKSTYAAGAH